MNEYADDPEWDYGFRLDGATAVWSRVFGMRISSAASAKHAAWKSFMYEYEIVRHPKGSDRDDDWEPLPEVVQS